MEHNNVFGYARFRGDKVYDLTPTKAFYVEDISGLYNVLSIKKNDEFALTITVEKSTDGITWETMGSTSTTAITAVIPAYGKLYLRASATRWSISERYYNTITASKRHNIGGNILSLLHGSTFTGYTRNISSNQDYIFAKLFYGNTNLVSAGKLILNTTLTYGCYQSMFQGCTALTTAPELPATTSAIDCYRDMFRGCTRLTTAPSILPATTLTYSCYQSMFYGCSALTTAPSLPATTLANYCYCDMFYGCSALTTAPSLPATTLAYQCYYQMFRDCTALTTAPALPATTLADQCYYRMFFGCSVLTTAPSILPATTLASNCYYGMFQGCIRLTTAPELPATTLANQCYSSMFYSCSRLNYIKCLATNISAEYCLTSWVSGVAATGTFVKDANMTSWPTGASGIPSGWIVRANGTNVSQDNNVATILTWGCDSGTAYYTINGGSHITINQDTTTIPITQAMNGQTLYVYAEYAGQSDEKTLILSWTDYSPAVTISVSDNYATITSATADTILYRLGSSGNYSTYTSPIYIAETTTLYVQATKTVSGVDYTTNTSQNVTHTAIPPTNLQISCSNNTVTITADQAQTIQYRFSTSDPWTTYTAPFAIAQTVTVYAQASNNDGTISGSQECVYVTIPSAPTGLVSTLNGHTIDLSWNASSGATSYEVYRSTTASGTYTLVTTVTATSASINALSGDNYIKVKAVNNIGSSDFSTYTYQNYAGSSGLIFHTPLLDDNKDIIGNKTPISGYTAPVSYDSIKGAQFSWSQNKYLVYRLTKAETESVTCAYCEYIPVSGSSRNQFLFQFGSPDALTNGVYVMASWINTSLKQNITSQYSSSSYAYDSSFNYQLTSNNNYKIAIYQYSSSVQKVYINGSLVFTNSNGYAANNNYYTSSMNDNNCGLVIGSRAIGRTGSNARVFNGYIRNVKLYDKTFTEDELIAMTTL